MRRSVILLAASTVLTGCGAQHKARAERAIVYEELEHGRSCDGQAACLSDEAQLIFPRGSHHNAVGRAERSLKRPCGHGEVLLVKLPGYGRCVSGRQAREWEGAPAAQERFNRVMEILRKTCPNGGIVFTPDHPYRCVK